MEIREELVLLSELGLVDQKLVEARERQKAIPHKADAAKARAKALLDEKNSLEDKKKQLHLLRKQKETDLLVDKANVRKWEDRANRIRGDREYTALMSEIGAQKRVTGQKENEILEVMQQIEDCEKKFADISESQILAQAMAETEWSAVETEIADVGQLVNQITHSREALLAKLPKSMADRYERIASRRAGRGVAFLRKEVCQACMRTVPPELAMRVTKAEIIEQCPACQRILVTEDLSFAKPIEVI